MTDRQAKLAAELVAVRAALQPLIDAALRVVDAYDKDESGFSYWQEILALEKAVHAAAATEADDD